MLVAGTLAPSPRVDGFFAANQIYALALYLGQAVRITAPALLVASGIGTPSLNRASWWLAAGTIAFMVALALFGGGLVAEPARAAFRSDLLVLAPAAGIHVAAGGLAARMATAGSYGFAAGAYAAGSVVSGLLLLVTIDASGASALAPCISAGGFSVGVIMVVSFHVVRRTRGLDVPEEGSSVRSVTRTIAVGKQTPFALRRIGLGAVPALSMQLLITVVTLAAGHVVAGGTALLSYAFLALFAFTTIAITPMSIVLGAEVAERWSGDPDVLVEIIRKATRLAMVFAVPLVAVGFLVGRPVASELLTALTDRDLDQIFAMLAVLCPSLLLAAAATAATVGITAADRLGSLALGLLATSAVAVVVGIVLAAVAPPLLVVAAFASGLSLVFSVVTIVLAVPRRVSATIRSIVRDNVAIIVPPLAVTAVLTPLVETDLGLGALFGAAVVVLHVGVVLVLRPDTVEMLVGAARRGKVA